MTMPIVEDEYCWTIYIEWEPGCQEFDKGLQIQVEKSPKTDSIITYHHGDCSLYITESKECRQLAAALEIAAMLIEKRDE